MYKNFWGFSITQTFVALTKFLMLLPFWIYTLITPKLPINVREIRSKSFSFPSFVITLLTVWWLLSSYIISCQFQSACLHLYDTLKALHPFLSRIVHIAVPFSITCNNERAFVRRLIVTSKKQAGWLWPPSNGKIVRMHWNSMVPMARVPSDRGTLTQLERRNQSYLRRLSDQDNNRVTEREKGVPLFTRVKPTSCRWLSVAAEHRISFSLGEHFVEVLSCGHSSNCSKSCLFQTQNTWKD